MRKRILVPTAALIVIAAVVTASAFAISSGATRKTDVPPPGRALTGAFCSFAGPNGTINHLCMEITYGDLTYNRKSAGNLTLLPGAYWITVTDSSMGHNFELRGPTGTAGENAGSDGLALSGDDVTDTPGAVTTRVILKPGWYRLYCDATGHEAGGMWVDFQVGGNGQVG